MDRTPPDLETLMAYADGALPADEMARVEQYLATDTVARAQVEQLRLSGALAAQAFATDLAQPLPPALQASVEQAIARHRAARRDNAGQASHEPASARSAAAPGAMLRFLDWLGLTTGPRFGLAAAAVTVLAGAIGFVIGSNAPPQQGFLSSAPIQLLTAAAEQDEFVRALDTVPSGQRRALGTSAQMELVASFRDATGTLCREFSLQRADRAALAVACRQDGQWAVSFASAAPPGGSYAPAGSPAAALDAYVAAIGGSAPLSAAEEARALLTR